MQHLLGDVVPARIVSGGLNDLTPDFDSRLAYALNHLCVVSRCDTKTRLEKGLQRFARRPSLSTSDRQSRRVRGETRISLRSHDVIGWRVSNVGESRHRGGT